MFKPKSVAMNMSILSMLLFISVGCIKNKVDLPNQPLSEYINVYMPQAVKSPVSYSFSATDTIPDMMIYGAYYAGQDVADKDISIDFGINATVVDSFNMANNTNYVLLPEYSYRMDTSAVIKKGSVSTDPLKISVSVTGPNAPSDPTRTYILPVYIKSASVSVSETLNTVFYVLNFANDGIPIVLKRADTLMTSLVHLFLDGKPRDIWTNQYPQGGGYWDGAAMVWGQGGVFSGYAALKEAAEKFTDYKSKYQQSYDDRLFNSLDKFITTQGNYSYNKATAYAVYPANGNDRFYDDNLWIGIDMTDLYSLTKKNKYLDRAKMVWNFVQGGIDTVLGGGVYWKENDSAKMTCSNAPAAVLGAKLYQATQDVSYLTVAKSVYTWCKKSLQDPSDYLYWDNIRYSNNGAVEIAKGKYTYNSGQAIEAAALLYNITGDQQYLTDAQNIAKSIFKQWGTSFHSNVLGETFDVIDPSGDVWFRSVMLRGLIELYKIDKNRTYVNAYEKLLANAWLSDCRDRSTNLLSTDFRGGTSQSSWYILPEGACVEMLARLALLQEQGL